MLAMKPGLGLPTVGLSGFAPAACGAQSAVRTSAVRLARAVAHPFGRVLDRMRSRHENSAHDRS